MRLIKVISISLFVLIALSLLPFIFALLQLNSLALLVDGDPKIIGILKDRSEIISSLKSNNMPPHIVITEPEQVVYSLATAMSGEENIYGKYVVPTIPQSLVWQKKSHAGMLLIDNILIISELHAHDLEAMSPIIGYLLVKEYFPERQIKSYPKVSILENEAYAQYRAEQFGKKLKDIDKEIKIVRERLGMVFADTERDRDMISQNQKAINEAELIKETKYKKCCSAMRRKLDKQIVQWKKNISDWSLELENDQKTARDYESYINFYNKQKDLMEIKKGNIPYELGIFESEKQIQIVSHSCHPREGGDPGKVGNKTKEWIPGPDEGTHRLVHPEGGRLLDRGGLRPGMTSYESCEKKELGAYYFGTLMHEYLHYTSYISKDPPTRTARQGKKFTNNFFEEGLTEYFARKIMEKHFERSSGIAYPVQTKIIKEMTKKIPEKEFAAIYFSKDQKRLENILDKTYGKDFYKNNELLFQTLQYTSDLDHVLKITNDLMRKIGGEPIKSF